MAKVDGDSILSDYSESFELDDSTSANSSLNWSQEENSVLSEFKKSHFQSESCSAKDHKKPPTFKKDPGELNRSHDHVDLSRTIRSPIQMSQHLKGNDDRPVLRSSTGNGISIPPMTMSYSERPIKFKEVAGTIHTLQNATKSFKNSSEIRDIAFREWLAEKDVQGKEMKQLKAQENIQREKKRGKEEATSERSAKKVEKWIKSKETQLQIRKKQVSEEEKKKTLEMEDKWTKLHEGNAAAEKWREEKKKQFIQQQRQKMKDEEKKIKQMEADKVGKEMDSKQAFEYWNQNKKKILREDVKKKIKHAQESEQIQKEQENEKWKESKEAYEAWKSTKDDQIKKTKTLYTHNTQGKIHERSWCPARSIEYSYPASKTHSTLKKPKEGIRDGEALDSSMGSSYSTASFESGSSRTRTSEFNWSENSSISQSASSNKGTHKTIQVCCQTLQYWCTCEDNTT